MKTAFEALAIIAIFSAPIWAGYLCHLMEPLFLNK